MSDQMEGVRLEGTVHASRYDPTGRGKQFLGAAIESDDGKMWMIDYDEDSPFQDFDGRRVVALGEPYKPDYRSGQFLIESKALGHFRVASVTLVDMSGGEQFVEVGALQRFRGRFRRTVCDAGEGALFLVTENGDTFLVANDSAEAAVDRSIEVMAYPVQLLPSLPRPPWPFLWIRCTGSGADQWWEWRSLRP